MTMSENPFIGANANITPPPPSERELSEVLRQKLLYELIITRAERVTAGYNGIVLRLPYEGLPDDQKEQMRSLGFEWDTEAAIKILKILNPEQSEREFRIQQKAYELLKGQENPEDFAQIPKPLYHGHISLDGGRREALSEKADYDFKHKGAQIIAMDFVDGDDLATVANREILHYLYDHLMARKEIAPLVRNFKDTWNLKDYNDLQKALEELFRTIESFDYRMTGLHSDLILKYPSEGATSAETLRRVYNANAKAKMELLKASGFSFNPEIPKNIVKTVRLLKEHGIIMTDSHQRNFMVKGDVTGDGDVEAFVIDFGDVHLDGDLAMKYGSKPVEAVGAEPLDGENVVHWLVGIQKAAGRLAAAKKWNE